MDESIPFNRSTSHQAASKNIKDAKSFVLINLVLAEGTFDQESNYETETVTINYVREEQNELSQITFLLGRAASSALTLIFAINYDNKMISFHCSTFSNIFHISGCHFLSSFSSTRFFPSLRAPFSRFFNFPQAKSSATPPGNYFHRIPFHIRMHIYHHYLNIL